MATDLPIRCAFGRLQGKLKGVDGTLGNRLVCYCDDCQSFARFLRRTDELLDPNGGTDIFQTTPNRIDLTAGIEELACVNLKTGGLMRWNGG